MKLRTSRHLLCVTVFGLPTLIGCKTVFAQDFGDGLASQKVVVTGSYLRRADVETPSPVQVISAEDLRNSGRTSVQEVLRDLTANGQGMLSQSFASAVASGGAGISLRGLSVGATLVLIDGHRMAPYPLGDDGQRSFVDVATLPFDAIERIEILKDSGSSAYGSDAIAGVVNIILKKSVVGGTISGDVGTSERGGGTLRRVAGLFGAGDLDADGHNGWLGVEYRAQDRIRFTDRRGLFTKTDFRSSGGDNITSGAHNPSVGGHPLSGTGYVTNPGGDIVGFMPGCDATKFAADQCTYGDTWHVIVPQTENLNVTGRWTQRVGREWQLSVQGSFFDSQAEQRLQPMTSFTTGFQGVAFGPGRVPMLLAPLPPTTIPSTNPSFPVGTGLNEGNLYYTFLDYGGFTTNTDARSTRAIADLQGRAGDWDVTASLGYTQVALEVRYFGAVQPAALQAALDSTTAPFLVGGHNSAEVLASIAPELHEHDTSRLTFAHLGMTRDLANLAGGPLSLAFGADDVHRSVHVRAPSAYEDGLVGYGTYYTIGAQDVASVYTELAAPVLKNLELEASARYDHYASSIGRVSPKAGIKFSPSPTLALVGTASRGFRAPGPAENGNSAQAFSYGATADPVLCPDGNPATVGNFPTQCNVALPGLLTTSRALRPEKSTAYSLGLVFEPSKDVGGRLELWSIRVDDQVVLGGTPTSVRGSNLAPIDQVQPDGSTALVVPPVAPIAYQAFNYVNANSTSTAGVDIDLHATHRLAGFGELRTTLTLSHTAKYDLTVDGATYHLAGTHGPASISGDTGNPRTRIQWVNTLVHGDWLVSATLNHVSSYGVTDPSSSAVTGVPEGNCLDALTNGGGRASHDFASALANGQIPTAVNCRVGSLTTVDLNGRYQFTKWLDIHATIQNLFGRGAPVDWATYGGNGSPYNSALHMTGEIGRYYTIGASLKW